MATVLLMTVFLSSWTPPAQRYAVLVGNNQGHRTTQWLPTLRYAEDDAKSVAAVLLELGGFSPNSVEHVLGKEADDLLARLTILSERADKTPLGLLLFYFSGHADGNGLLMGNTDLSYSDLRAALKSINARVVVAIVDACQSGSFFTRPKGTAPAADPVPIELWEHEVHRGRVLISSSLDSELALESDALQGSFFTHHFVTGLRGVADVSPRDGVVSLYEAYTHVYHTTVAATGRTRQGTQHPMWRNELQGCGQYALTRQTAQQGILILPSGMDGKLMIEAADASDQTIREFTSTRSSPRRTWLNAGEYRILSRRTNDYAVQNVTIKAGQETSLATDEGAWTAYSYDGDQVPRGEITQSWIGAAYTIGSPYLRSAPAPQGFAMTFLHPTNTFYFGARMSFGISTYDPPDADSVRVIEAGGALVAERPMVNTNDVCIAIGGETGVSLVHQQARENNGEIRSALGHALRLGLRARTALVVEGRTQLGVTTRLGGIRFGGTQTTTRLEAGLLLGGAVQF